MDKVTLVRMRIDFMGDKPYAEMIYSLIDENLGIIEFDHGVPKTPKNIAEQEKKRRDKKNAPDDNQRRRLLRNRNAGTSPQT